MDDSDLPKVSTRTSPRSLKVVDEDRQHDQKLRRSNPELSRAVSVQSEVETLLCCQYASSEPTFDLFCQTLFLVLYANILSLLLFTNQLNMTRGTPFRTDCMKMLCLYLKNV